MAQQTNWQQIACEIETRPNSAGDVLLGDFAALDLSAYAGQVHCLYVDPPFLTGSKFRFRQKIGEEGWKTGKKFVDLDAYSDQYASKAAYLDFLRSLLVKSKELLSEDGAFFLHLDTRMDAHGRLLCDEIFGETNFVNQIIWSYQSGGRTVKRFSTKHDVILFYRKSPDLRFDITTIPLDRTENRSNHMRKTVDAFGRPCRTIKSGGKTYVYYDDDPVYPDDVWSDLSHLQQKDPQRTGHDTQKPRALLERMIKPVSLEGELCCDLCCGSGTTAVAAGHLKRKFLVADQSIHAVSVTRKRLVSEEIPFTLHAPCEMRSARIDAHILPGIAFYDVYLSAFEPFRENQEKIEGLDAVDQWSAGYLREGVFVAYAEFVRSKKTPALPELLQIPVLNGTPAVMVVDVYGRKYCFAQRE